MEPDLKIKRFRFDKVPNEIPAGLFQERLPVTYDACALQYRTGIFNILTKLNTYTYIEQNLTS